MSIPNSLAPCILLIFTCMLLFSNCGEKYTFKGSKDFESGNWQYADPADFSVEISDTSSLFDLGINLVHSTNYSYQNIYMMISTNLPDGNILKKQFSIDLSDKGGKWFGNCGRNNCDLQFTIQKSAFFDSPGTYQFTFEQFMRVDPMPGIESLTFWIRPTGIPRN